MTTHYTRTGLYAGMTLCGAPRNGIGAHGNDKERFIHPRTDYTPEDVCPECQRLWDEAGTEDETTPEADCPACGTWNSPMGRLGTMDHYLCRDCGMEYARRA